MMNAMKKMVTDDLMMKMVSKELTNLNLKKKM